MNINEKIGKIDDKKVVLYGDSNDIANFLNRYGNRLTVDYIITDVIGEIKIQPYLEWGCKTVLYDNVDMDKDLFVIICSENDFEKYAKRLMYSNEKEYYNYISYRLVEGILENKKLMVCMGEPLMQQVYTFLSESPRINKEYNIAFFAEADILEPYKNKYQEYVHMSRFCDVYIRSECDKKAFLSKIADSSVLNDKCKKIVIADFEFRGYYPQIKYERYKYSDYLMREMDRLELSYETLAFSFIDEEFANFCGSLKQEKAIIDKLMSKDLYSENYIKENFTNEIKRLRDLEKNADIKISDFIERNRGKKLSRNLYEWEEPVVSYIADQILETLDIEDLELNTDERKRLIIENSGSEMLIYPSVAFALGLEMTDYKYTVKTYYHEFQMDIVEYIKFLITYTTNVLDIFYYTKMDKNLY